MLDRPGSPAFFQENSNNELSEEELLEIKHRDEQYFKHAKEQNLKETLEEHEMLKDPLVRKEKRENILNLLRQLAGIDLRYEPDVCSEGCFMIEGQKVEKANEMANELNNLMEADTFQFAPFSNEKIDAKECPYVLLCRDKMANLSDLIKVTIIGGLAPSRLRRS